MLAVLFSLLLTLYLIIPEAIFRTVFGWYVPPRNFVLSRAETAYRALAVALMPLALAWLGVWYVPAMQSFPFPVKGNSAELRRADYRLVTSALYSEEEYRGSKKEFWPAFTRCSRRQAHLISYYVLFILLEAWIAGYFAENYAKYKRFRLYNWIADKFLFSYISEWHPLLTPYMFVDKDTTVQADILSTNDTLYQGTVTQHFLKEGTLTGIFLTDPKRFNRAKYVQDVEARAKAGEQKPDANAYWKSIPSQSLYFFADKIFNMNLTYKSPVGKVDAETLRKLVIQISGSPLATSNITITQEKAPAKKKEEAGGPEKSS